jgi:O-antigen/teichoic acid export membrane protein
VAASIPVTLVGTPLRGVLEAGYRFGLVNLVTIPASMLIYLFSAVGSTAGLDVAGIVALILVSRIAATTAFVVLSRGVYPGLLSARPTDRAALGELVSFGGWVTVSTIAGTVFAYADRIFISVVSSIGAVVYYAVPYEIVARLWIVPNAVSAALFPAFSLARGSTNPALASLYERALHVLLWLIQPIVVLLFLFGDELLQVWVGSDIAVRGGPVLRILAVGVLVNSVAFVPFSLIQGANRPDLTGKLQGAALLPFLVVGLVFVHVLGPLGIALSMTIRLTVEAALLFATAAAVVPVVSSVHAKSSTIANLSVAAVSLLGGFALQEMAAPLVVRAVYALVAVAIALALGLTKALGASQKIALHRALRVGVSRISH